MALAWLGLAASALPVPALAQGMRAGIVTSLEGAVTAARAVTPQPVALKFKDDIFLQDRVVTGEQSFARLLLGGKAVISIRERSAVTITEIPGRSVVDVESGKIALSVARGRMLPGEVINLKTPNAIAGVRGTVVVAQVTHSLGPGGAPQTLSNLWVIRGLVDAVHTNAQGAPLGAPVTLQPQESFNATPTGATTGTFTLEQIGTIVEGLQPQRNRDGGSDSQGPARLEAANTTAALLNALVGTTEAEKQVVLLTGPPPSILSPDTLPKQTVTSVADVSSSGPAATAAATSGVGSLGSGDGGAGSVPTSSSPFTLPHVFSGPAPENRSETGPVGSFTGLQVDQSPGDDLVRVAPDANVTLLGPLVALTNSQLTAGDAFLSVAGRLASSSPEPLISLEPTTVTAPGAMVEVVGILELGGALVKDLGGTITAGAGIVAVSEGGTLKGPATGGAAPQPLLQLTGTAASAGAVLSVVGQGSSVDLAGPLLSMQGGRLALSGRALADVSGGGRVSSRSTLPFVDMIGTELFLPDKTFTVSGGELEVGGSLLRAENIPSPTEFALVADQRASVSIGGPAFDLIQTTAGARIVVGGESTLTTSSGPLVRASRSVLVSGTLLPVNGETSPISGLQCLISVESEAAGHAGPYLRGVSGTTQAPLTLKDGGALLEARGGAFVDIKGPNGNVVRLDAALLDATGPLISLVEAGLRTGGHAINLANGSKLESRSAEALVKLENQARMDVLSGHLVNVSAGRLDVAGDMLRMNTNATLNVLNGVLLDILNGGSVNIRGALVSFRGTNGVINVTNDLRPTKFIAGIPVFIAQGANVSIAPESLVGLNTNGNTITINNTVLPTGATAATAPGISGSLVKVGANGTLRIGPLH